MDANEPERVKEFLKSTIPIACEAAMDRASVVWLASSNSFGDGIDHKFEFKTKLIHVSLIENQHTMVGIFVSRNRPCSIP